MEYDLNKCDRRNLIPELEDILKNIIPFKTEWTNNKKVFVYDPKIFAPSKGIIFPNDDIVCLNKYYDVIITNLKPKGKNSYLILSEIYHCLGIEDILSVRISGKSKRNVPMFKLYGFLGFVNSGEVEIGEEVKVRINRIKDWKDYYYLLETEII